MAFYSYLTELMVHIGMEAMHCAWSAAHWTKDSFNLSNTHAHSQHIHKRPRIRAHVWVMATWKVCLMHSQKYGSTCSPWVNMHSFMRMHAGCMNMYAARSAHSLSENSNNIPVRALLLLQRVSLKLSKCIGWQTSLWSETHTCHRVPQWSIQITTKASEHADWTEMNWFRISRAGFASECLFFLLKMKRN